MINGKSTIRYEFEAIRSNVPFRKLRAIPGGNVLCDAKAEIKRSLSCTILVEDDVDFLTDQLRVSMIKDDEKQLVGTFVVTTAPKTKNEYGIETWSIEAYDRTYLVQRKKIESMSEVYVLANAYYTDAIESLLIACGISDFIIEASAARVTTTHQDWEIGTSYLQIINELLDEMNYTSLWFDEEGVAHASPYVSPVIREPNFEYRSGSGSIVLSSHTVDDDTFAAANVFMVMIQNLDGEAIYAKAVNDDPTSRLSTVRRGRIAAPVVYLQDTPSQQAAQEYANNLKLKSMISTETATIRTAPEALHEVFDIVAVDVPGLSGKFEEIGWSIDLDASGLMSHTLRRAIYV